jgi:hypothetical protein
MVYMSRTAVSVIIVLKFSFDIHDISLLITNRDGITEDVTCQTFKFKV